MHANGRIRTDRNIDPCEPRHALRLDTVAANLWIRGNNRLPARRLAVQALCDARHFSGGIAHGRIPRSSYQTDAAARGRQVLMSLKPTGVIEIPAAIGSAFDHGVFDARSRRIFIAHTARSTVEVIDRDEGRHIATLPGFPGAAGAVADDGEILVTNRGSASLAWIDGSTLKTKAVLETGARPNGAAIVKRLSLGVVACIGEDRETPTLQSFHLKDGSRKTLDLPGRPRWCVTDSAAERLLLCIREPSMILVTSLPD